MTLLLATETVEVRHFHLFCGLGGGARGFNRGRARVRHLEARFRCIGGVDVSPAVVRDFERLAGARGTVLDLFDVGQYRAYHGKEPPAGWREATVEDIRRAAGGERPHIIFTSPPCKGFSGLLSQQRSGHASYQALNRLTLRGIMLALEAWADDPPEFFILENVPRIQTRGRPLLDQIVAVLGHHGYNVAETTHDCGELGELAQSRRRFLLVARHREKVPPFLYEPTRRPLRAVGQVLDAFPLPGAPEAGPMHRMRALQWKTWVRLAFVEAGGDWRSLERLRVQDGYLADFAIAPEAGYHNGALGVTPWSEPAGTVTGGGRPGQGSFSVADPRMPPGTGEYAQLGVQRWDEPSCTLTGQSAHGGGRFSVADPRLPARDNRHANAFRVTAWDGIAGTVCGPHRPGGGDLAVADPRIPAGARYFPGVYGVTPWGDQATTVTGESSPNTGRFAVADPRLAGESPRFNNVFRVVRWDGPAQAVTGPGGAAGQAVADPRAGEGWHGNGKYRVTRFDEPVGAVIAASTTGNGAFAVADPRAALRREDGAYQTSGHYGVVPWGAPAGAVTGAAGHDNGPFNVADPRASAELTSYVTPQLPAADERLVAVIRALDDTWHRPFTTLELAALQGLVVPGEHLELEGLSDSAWRERIGNAVPPPTSQAIASVMGTALLLAWLGETFVLDAMPIWVRPLVVAAAVDVPREGWIQ